ncbi:MAG TPA: MDR family oxidoreductase [Anaeromyxobacteraceae bacterium]|nr:MDR family oxidoreductase [Anaeromyxobacteraceae bacterium]
MPAGPDRFRAFVIREMGGKRTAAIESLTAEDLPEGDVTVEVSYSSLNYKDGLAVTGEGKVLRRLPMVPGIDLAGTVVESRAPAFRAGDSVVLTGFGVGEVHFGGYAERARLKSEWLLPLPTGLSPRRAMAVGTAGLTSMLCVLALEQAGLKPGAKEVLVTGAAGGVGSLAVVILARLGYRVAASTGRPAEAPYLQKLGAQRILTRAELAQESGKPLEAERWAGAVDTVGGATLATVLKQTSYGGAVAACGLAGGSQLSSTVFPFILRGVALLGVDSVQCPRSRRIGAWRRIAEAVPPEVLDALTSEIGLSDIAAWSERILEGQVRGRVVVDVSA